MAILERSGLLESIATITADYRIGETIPMSPEHVDRWVQQFDNNDQLVILGELDRILKFNYISRQKAERFIDKLLENEKIFGADPKRTISETKFLQIQRKGESQSELITLAAAILRSKYRLNVYTCGTSPNMYIYIDDCLFSGNTAFHDLNIWIEEEGIADITLNLVFLALHRDGYRYNFKKRFRRLAKSRNIAVIYCWLHSFNNIRWESQKFDCLWPRTVNGDAYVDDYIRELKSQSRGKSYSPRLFRPTGVPAEDALFSSPAARDVIERAFLKAGAYIVSLPDSPQPHMRPMGYEYLPSLGFGAVFVTYRNIANNCPLALWWGDPDYPASHPFSKWYPLFPRKSNEPLGD